MTSTTESIKSSEVTPDSLSGEEESSIAPESGFQVGTYEESTIATATATAECSKSRLSSEMSEMVVSRAETDFTLPSTKTDRDVVEEDIFETSTTMRDCDTESDSSFISNDDGRTMARHVQSLTNPHDYRDLLIRCTAGIIIIILMSVGVSAVNSFKNTNEKLRSEGIRTLTSVPCSEQFSKGTILSWGLDGKYHPGMGITVKDVGTYSISPAVAVGSNSLEDFISVERLPPHENTQRDVVISASSKQSTLSLAVVVHGSYKRNERYSIPLRHTTIVKVIAHGDQQHSGEWDILILHTSSNQLSAITVSLRIDGNINVNNPVVIQSIENSTSMSWATWMSGLPLRYLVVTEQNGISFNNVIEASSTNHLTILQTTMSDSILFSEIKDVKPLRGIQHVAIVLTSKFLVAVMATSDSTREIVNREIICNGKALFSSSSSDSGSGVIVCSEGFSYELYTSSDLVNYTVTDSIRPVSLFLRKVDLQTPVGWQPLFSSGYSNGEYLLVGTIGGSSDFIFHKIATVEGSLSGSYPLVLSAATHSSIGLHGNVLVEFDSPTKSLIFRTISWSGGFTLAGLALQDCSSSISSVAVMLSGLVDLSLFHKVQNTPIVMFPLFADSSGIATQNRRVSQLFSNFGKVVSHSHAVVDFISAR